MKTRFFAFAFAVAGLTGCNSGYVPPSSPSYGPGPAHDTEFRDGRPGAFGDLTWTFDLKSGEKATPAAAATSTPAAAAPAAAGAAAASAAEQEEFKKWRESAGATERQEFDDWRAWQEWKRKNPK